MLINKSSLIVPATSVFLIAWMCLVFKCEAQKNAAIDSTSDAGKHLLPVQQYLLDKYGARKASENREDNIDLELLWEYGPFRIEDAEILYAFEKNYSFYVVCSNVHGIPSPSFRKILIVNSGASVMEMKYDDHVTISNCLRKNRNKNDLKTIAVGIMKILSHQYCLNVFPDPNDVKMSKKNGLFNFSCKKGTGYSDPQRAAYAWTVQFDMQLNCVRSKLICDLPPVP